MRLLVLVLLLAPFSAQAKDITIHVNYVVTQERVEPEPKTVHPHVSVVLTLHQNGSVDESSHSAGSLGGLDSQHTSKLGGKRVNVVNEHTITRTANVNGSIRVLTVTATGNACVASLRFEGASEFRSMAADFHQMATFRNPRLESIDCKIE